MAIFIVLTLVKIIDFGYKALRIVKNDDVTIFLLRFQVQKTEISVDLIENV